jgi:hypothetical protein
MTMGIAQYTHQNVCKAPTKRLHKDNTLLAQKLAARIDIAAQALMLY